MEFLDFLVKYGGLIFWGVLIIIYVTSLIIKRVKGHKVTLADIYEEIPQYVANAEKMFGEGKGEAKFDHVLKTLRLDAVDSGFKLDIAKVTAMINAVVKATKEVNNASGLSLPITNTLDKEN